jgi:HEAT repeat protein
MLLLNESTPSLLPLLRDPDAHVRSIAATCLGIYGGAQGVQAASELWSDQDAYVRKSLVDMLAVVRAPGSLTVVKQLLADQDEGVRRAAQNALSKSKSVEMKGRKYSNVEEK